MQDYPANDECPHCHLPIDRTTDMSTELTRQHHPTRQPQPGDIMVCLRCANWSMFGQDLKRHLPDEMQKMRVESGPAWPILKKTMTAIKRLNAAKRQGNRDN